MRTNFSLDIVTFSVNYRSRDKVFILNELLAINSSLVRNLVMSLTWLLHINLILIIMKGANKI